MTACMAVMAACSGGGNELLQLPVISNLKYSPATGLQAPGGTATITGTFDFTDAGGDIALLRLVGSGGVDLSVATPALSGIRSGTGTGSFVVSVEQIGKYAFELWAVDSRGSASNRLSGTFEVLPDDTATSWIRLDVAPPSLLYGIAWNGRQYVAVGARGTVMTSTDLAGWAVQSAGVDATLRSVAASPSRLVAVGDAAGKAIVLGSADGAAWSVQFRSSEMFVVSSMLSKVIWTGTQFVAVGEERFVSVEPTWVPWGLILTSPDGITWTQRARRTIELGDWSAESAMSSVAWSGSLLVAVGIYHSSAAWTSNDAETWTRIDVPAAPASRHVLRDVTWGNGRFVAVGSGGTPAVYSSTDGVHWQGNVGAESLPAMNAVTAGASRYLAIGKTYRETSADGLAWTVLPSPDCGNGVLWDGKRYVSVGLSICRSP